MEAPVGQARRYTVEEYLRIEQDSTEKHEYRDGEIIAMAGGTYEHSVIIANFIGELRNRLKGGPCRVNESNLRVRLGPSNRYSYPDLSVTCGEPQFDPRDENRTILLNPRVVVEVLSASTEQSDRGEKFRRYLRIASLQEYVLVAQDQARVESYFRQPDGTWLFSFTTGREATAKLRSLGIELPLAELYAGVEFPPLQDDEQDERVI